MLWIVFDGGAVGLTVGQIVRARGERTGCEGRLRGTKSKQGKAGLWWRRVAARCTGLGSAPKGGSQASVSASRSTSW